MANVESATRDVSLKHSRNKLNLYTLQNTSCGKKQENTDGYAVNAQMIPISFLFNYSQIKPKKNERTVMYRFHTVSRRWPVANTRKRSKANLKNVKAVYSADWRNRCFGSNFVLLAFTSKIELSLRAVLFYSDKLHVDGYRPTLRVNTYGDNQTAKIP